MSEISLLLRGAEIARWAVLPRWAVFGKFPLLIKLYCMFNVKFKKALLRLDSPLKLFQDGSYPVLTKYIPLLISYLYYQEWQDARTQRRAARKAEHKKKKAEEKPLVPLNKRGMYSVYNVFMYSVYNV